MCTLTLLLLNISCMSVLTVEVLSSHHEENANLYIGSLPVPSSKLLYARHSEHAPDSGPTDSITSNLPYLIPSYISRSELVESKKDDSTEDAPDIPTEAEYEDEHDIHDHDANLVFPRSPVRSAQQNADPVEEGKKFFRSKGSLGSDVLQGVGQRLKANQEWAERAADSASGDLHEEQRIVHDLAHDVLNAPSDQVIQAIQDEAVKARELKSRHSFRYKAAQNIMKQKGVDIDNIGLTNKEMQKRMKANFQALPNPRRQLERGWAQARTNLADRPARQVLGYRGARAERAAQKLYALPKPPSRSNAPHNQDRLSNLKKGGTALDKEDAGRKEVESSAKRGRRPKRDDNSCKQGDIAQKRERGVKKKTRAGRRKAVAQGLENAGIERKIAKFRQERRKRVGRARTMDGAREHR